jgi:hypothetical protein
MEGQEVLVEYIQNDMQWKYHAQNILYIAQEALTNVLL